MLDAAREIIAEAGVEGLSMRELARRVGVSYGAPHHHFSEKDSLLAAIATEAFAELRAQVLARIEASAAAAADPLARLELAARAYLDFATSERSRYRVMFLPVLRDRQRFVELHQTGGEALAVLGEAFVAAGVPAGAAKLRAVACWSTLHGYAVLANDDFLDEASMGERAALERTIIATAIS
nr:TetR/AcrR family transcriptional regulator [Pseudenhygromyxa sp. WMMC2535]